jgi:hypothetical protein
MTHQIQRVNLRRLLRGSPPNVTADMILLRGDLMGILRQGFLARYGFDELSRTSPSRRRSIPNQDAFPSYGTMVA